MASLLEQALAEKQRRQAIPSSQEGGALSALLAQAEKEKSSRETGPFEDLIDSIGTGALRGIENVLDLPNHIATSLMKVAGISPQTIEKYQLNKGLGSYLESGLTAAGLQAPRGEEVEMPFVGRVAQEVGGALVPLGAIGVLARLGKGGRLLEPIIDTFRRAPVSATAAELSSAAGAGVGAALANELAPDNPYAEVAGQLIGGFASPITLMSRAASSKAAGRAANQVRALMPRGDRSRASQILSQSAAPGTARVLSQTPSGLEADLTPAQLSQDAGLQRLEQTLSRDNPELALALQSRQTQTQEGIKDAQKQLAGDTPGAQMRDYLEGRVSATNEKLRQAEERASAKATNAALITRPQRDRVQSSQEAKAAIEEGLGRAKKEEKALWSQVPKDTATPTQPLKKAFESVLSRQRPISNPRNIPRYAAEFINKLPDTIPLADMQAFRSRLLQDLRDEQQLLRPPSQERMATLKTLQSAALRSMEQSPMSEPLRKALDFSRELNTSFRQGGVGKARKSDLPLETLIPHSGPQGSLNIQQLESALGAHPDLLNRYREAAADFIRARFASQALNSQGKVQREAASRFVTKHKELLDLFPDVRKEIMSASKAQAMADRVAKSAGLRRQGLLDQRKSRAALYLNAPVGKEIASVLASKDPSESMKSLVKLAKKDPQGLALKGLKGQLLQTMFDKAGVNGVKLQDFYKQHRKALEAALNQTELQSLKDIIAVAKKTAPTKLPDAVIDDAPSQMLDLLARIGGANLGSAGAIGSGAPLIAASAGSKTLRRLTQLMPNERVKKVLAEAVLDRRLMRDLLKNPKLPQDQEALNRRLNAFLVNLFGEPESESENPASAETGGADGA